MDHKTERYLCDAGNWEKIDLKKPPNEEAWAIFPRIYGELIK